MDIEATVTSPTDKELKLRAKWLLVWLQATGPLACPIHQLLVAGMSKKAVARELGIGRASVYRAIEAGEA